jgi:hypothetical protein
MTRRSFALLATFLLTACPGEEGDDDGADASATTTATTTGADESGSEGATSSADTAMDGSTSGGGTGGGAAPVIESVAWTQAEGCMMNTGSDVSLVATVTDADTAAADLTFEWNIVGCTQGEDAPEVTVVCPQVSTYNATLTVTDPEGGDDSLDFLIPVCMDGMAP